MKITIIGTHGFPARYGGFETFAEHMAVACVKAGMKVTVINERNNLVAPAPDQVEIISSPYNKSTHPLKFYKSSLQLSSNSDVVLCCGVGGAYFFPGKRHGSYKIVTNIDGLEHKRKKYSLLQCAVIYFLQRHAARKSDFLVADCLEMWGYWTHRFKKSAPRTKMITYGVDACLPFEPSILKNNKVEQNEYFLIIARLVPENNIHHILDAYRHYIGRKKLVVVGALEDNSYVRKLKRLASEKVIFTDSIYDKKILDSLRQGCFIYLHGHSVGGTNPSLLEALAAGCACICHDNVFNREVTGGTQMYFDFSFDLAIMLNLFEHNSPDIEAFKKKAKERVLDRYSWEKTCTAYIELFNKLHIPARRSTSV